MSDLPRGWAVSTLGSLSEVVSGSTPRTSESRYWGGDIAWITPDDLSRSQSKTITRGARNITQAGYDSCSTRLVPAGTLLYTSRAPIGYVAIAAGPVCTNQGFKSFIPSDALISDYLYWVLVHATPAIRELGSGTTFPELSKSAAKTIPIPVPPLNEQRRIVSAIEEQLSRLDAADELLLRATVRLKALRRAVFSRAVSVGDSRSAGELLERIEAGKSFKCHGRPAGDEEWGVIKVSAMTWGSFDESENKAVLSAAMVDPRWEIKPGDLLLSRANTTEYVGASVLVDRCRPRLLLSDKSMRLIAKSDVVDKAWLHLALSAPESRAQMSAIATGTSDSMRNISQDKVKSIRLKVPSLPEQRHIVAELEQLLSLVDAQHHAIETARRRGAVLRRSILDLAFCGELVPQDPSDEPAVDLLDRIAAENAAVMPKRQQKAIA